MKEEVILARAKELAVLFSDVPDDVLMRFVNRRELVCGVFSRPAILRALAAKSGVGREQLKAFLCQSVPATLLKKPEWSWSTRMRECYGKNITCGGVCVFDPPLPEAEPERDLEYFENARVVAHRDKELLKKLQQADEAVLRREMLDEAEFNTACGNAETARAEAAFRDGLVKVKLAELERYVKEQMAELRRENRAYLESLRLEVLRKYGLPGETPDLPTPSAGLLEFRDKKSGDA